VGAPGGTEVDRQLEVDLEGLRPALLLGEDAVGAEGPDARQDDRVHRAAKTMPRSFPLAISATAAPSPLTALQGSDTVGGRDPAQIPVGAGQALVAELGLDELGGEALGGELRGVGVPQALGVDPLGDA